MQEFPMKPMYLRYKGVFDFEELYRFIYSWMHERRYRTQEDKYKNKPSSAWGFEHEVKISGSKKVDGYYKYYLRIIVHARDCAEIEHDGKSMLNGRLEVTITGKVITDYSKKFEKNKFTKFLEKIYTKMTIREIELLHWDVLYYRLHDFQEDMKKILNAYTEENYYRGT